MADRLARSGHTVGVVLAAGGPPEPGTALLLSGERSILRRGRPSGADPLDPPDFAAVLAPPEATFDLVVDLTHRPALAPGATTLVVAWDGSPGENAALAALLSGAMPVVEIAEGASGVVLERFHPSGEVAVGIGGGLEALGARLATVLDALVAAWTSGRHRPPPPEIEPVRRGAARKPNHILAGEVARAAARAAFGLFFETPHWRIGWRRNDGAGVLDRGDLSGPGWHVLADPGGRFYADPFPIVWNGEAAVFFEDLPHATGKGLIAVVRMGEGGPLGPAETVMEAPTHLSYPHLVEDGGALYMIPESSAACDVALWRCTAFPMKWERVATLLSGEALSDATVFRHGGKWWMTAVAWDGAGGYSDVLHLYHAPALAGPWTAHPANPVLVDRATARPAGAVVARDGRLLRPVQDCSHGYGRALGIAEIVRLDEEAFEQRLVHHVPPGGRWPGRKLHTLNRAGWLEVIDGSVVRPRTAPGRALAEHLTRPSP